MRDRIGLAMSILGHSDGHEIRAIDEAVLALLGVDIDEIRMLRGEGE